MQKTRTESKLISHRAWYLCAAFVSISGLVFVAAQASDSPKVGIENVPKSKVLVSQESIGQEAKSDCIQCHQFEPFQTHPVNVVPSINSSATLPLFQGKMTCLTCHDARTEHSVTREKVGIRGGDSATLCLECHRDASPGTKAVHSVTYGKAHATPGKMSQQVVNISGLDQESSDCLSCHDGALASVTGTHAAQLQGFEGQTDHPVGIPMRATSRTKDGDFRLAPIATLDRRIQLTQGNIACASCHNMYSQEPAKLVMSNQGSKLCLSCHTQ